MAQRGRYHTKQRELVSSCLAAHADRYLTIDEVWRTVTSDGATVGRSTVYRNLETMAADGSALKATAPGGEASYRIAQSVTAGQLVCLSCGKAYSLDCHMVGELSEHVLAHHGFRVEATRTVLYGTCASCMRSAS